MSNSIYVSRNKIFTILFTILVFICGMYQFYFVDSFSSDNLKKLVFIQSWVGIIFMILVILQWKRMTNKFVTLYTIFILFFTVFNFGQCILWAFNIHPENELGKVLMFSRVPCSDLLIVKAQLLYIVSLTCLNCGAVLSFSGKYNELLNKNISYDKGKIESPQEKICYDALFWASCFLSIIAIPATLYKMGYYYILVKNFGYTALGTTVSASNTVLELLAHPFFPCLIGLLIGSRNKKKVVVFVFSVYAIYAIIATMGGDRGEWITRFMVLIWIEFFYYNKISVKKGLKLALLALVGFWVVQAVISLRNKGLTIDTLAEALFESDNNPIVSCLTEFGHSMSIVMILLSRNIVYPYGNSYFVSILTMPSTDLVNGILGTQYVNIQDWFPKDILNISYGSDFSMIGEAVLNYGPYIAPLILGVIGYFVLKMTLYPYFPKCNPFVFCILLNAVSVLLKLPRSTTWFFLNSILYGTLFLGVAYIVIKLLIDKRKAK